MTGAVFFGFAMAGTGVVVLGVTYAAVRYRGKNGEPYSALNHFISELGERGVSRGAWAFNGALVLSGVLFLPFAVYLGTVLGTVLGWVGAGFAAVTALGSAAVGIFPMNTLKRHVPAAISFFYAGLVMALTTGIAILVQPAGRVEVPKAASVLSLLALLAFGSFLALPRILVPDLDTSRLLDPMSRAQRPRFWILPFMEWQVFVFSLVWLFGMAFFVQWR